MAQPTRWAIEVTFRESRVIHVFGYSGERHICTHYDAEMLVAPQLGESLRHGATTVVIGNCSLSTVYATPLDAADLFSRVEALPRSAVLKTLTAAKSWSSPREYADAVDALPLGPNVAALLGHCDVRTAVTGLGRATERAERPTAAELAAISECPGAALVGSTSRPFRTTSGCIDRGPTASGK